MDRWYKLLKPIQGAQVQNGTTRVTYLPAGISVRLIQPQRYQNVAEVEYEGAVIVLFYDDLCRRSRVRQGIAEGVRSLDVL